jgi:basic membrane protein A
VPSANAYNLLACCYWLFAQFFKGEITQMKVTRRQIGTVLAGTVLLAACAAPPAAAPAPAAPKAAEPTSAPAAAAHSGKIYYITPNPIGVNDFLKLGKKGSEEAAAKHGAALKILESEDPNTRTENVRAAINDGAGIVIVIGFEFGDVIAKVAPEASNVQFLTIDFCPDKPSPNVHCAVFREYEMTYLIGVEAGLLTKSNKVGVISALDIPFLHRYTDGFAAGVKSVNPNADIAIRWIGTDPSAFSDPAKAKEQALALAAEGRDQIFAAGAASNLGIFEAAKEKNFQTYGVDVNQCPLAEGFVVDNALKRVDNATVQSVDAIMAGSKENFLSYGLKEGGIGLVPFSVDKPAESKCLIAKNAEVIAKVKEVHDKIVSGELKLEDPMFKK